MQTSRLFAVVARRAAASSTGRALPRINAVQAIPRPPQRALCAPAQTPQAAQSQTPPASSTAAAAKKPDAKPAETSDTVAQTASTEATASTTATAPGSAATTEAAATGPTSATTPAAAAAAPTAAAPGEAAGAASGTGAKIPDVPSSSLGLFEEADAKDPNKWKKFAWKYAGAVLLFFVSYKTLHWYVDRVEAEGKRKRAQLDEDRKLARELRENTPETPNTLQQKQLELQDGAAPVEAGPDLQTQMSVPQFSAAANASAAAVPPVQGGADAMPEDMPARDQLEFLEQIAAQVPKGSSELDELYAFRKELQGQLDGLRKQGRAASEAEVADVEADLAAVVEDIAQLERKEGKAQ